MTFPLRFYPSKRIALWTAYTLLRDEVKRDEVVRCASSFAEVTPTERRRIDEVRDTLARGGNPYNREVKTTDDQGGLFADREELRLLSLRETVSKSDAVFEGLAAKWANKTGSAKSPTLRSHINRVVGIDLRPTDPNPWPTIKTPDGRTIPDPDLTKCSFCGVYLPRNEATTGKGHTQEAMKEEVTEIYGIKVITRKWIKWSSKLVACNKCCLNIRPTVHKDGSITNNVDIKGTS
jgi:hypothetical protein